VSPGDGAQIIQFPVADSEQGQLWMETEEIGLGDGWVRAIVVILALAFTLAIVLPLVLP
jgi:hypothetical protein